MPVQLNFHSRDALKVRVDRFDDFVTFEIYGEGNNHVTYYIRDEADALALVEGAMNLFSAVREMKAQPLDSDGTFTETDQGVWLNVEPEEGPWLTQEDWPGFTCNPVEKGIR